MLYNCNWAIAQQPFKHAYIRDVFAEQTYEQISKAFTQKFNRASSDSRVANYDAIIEAIRQNEQAEFSPIFDLGWLTTISKALNLDTTFEVDAAIHSHPPGSRTGWIHNDYNPGWFARAADTDEILLASNETCRYRNGSSKEHLPSKICRMRYLTMIYYLNNDDWNPNDGGQTGIYKTPVLGSDKPIFTIPPINNSLLLFECTPHSWHTFLTTSRRRNSITLWLHRSMESARQQWPHHEPVYWS